MNIYALRVKMPKNTYLYFEYFKKVVLDRCVERMADCVVEMLDGRILVSTDLNEPECLFEGVRGYISYHPVEIFEEFEELVEEVLKRMNGCESFAIRANRKALEKEIGARVVEKIGIKVNLTEPQCEVYVEKRGKVYLLFSRYP